MALSEYWPLWWLLTLAVLGAALWFTLVDRPRPQKLGAFALRALAVVLAVLALCRPSIPRAVDHLHVAFLVDVSASVDLGSAIDSLDRVQSAIDHLAPGDTWSLAAVGKGVRPFKSVAALRKVLRKWKAGNPDDAFRGATDLAGALADSRLSLPADAVSRVVVLSDAKPTGASVAPGLEELRGEGATVWLGKVSGIGDKEAAIASLTPSPAFAHEGEPVRLRAKLMANAAMPAQLRIVHRGVIVARRAVRLKAGRPVNVDVTVPMDTPGRSVWSAQVATRRDHFAVNNHADCTVNVSGRPRLLVVTKDPRSMRGFRRAMDKQGLVVETRKPQGLPDRLQPLLAFDAVVLADMPATDMAPGQMNLLRRYVGDFGGGLAMLGSADSFGLGGYYQTPVERVLPLVSRFEKEKEKPSMAMVLVIDKSGSMNGVKIAMARQAAKATVDLLGPRDQIGVVGFDSRATIACPMQSATDREAVKSAINRLGAGGGTFLYMGMDAGREMLQGASAKIKHMIVLSDGQTTAADHAALVQRLTDMGVTVSTVALGQGADQALLSRIAQLGRGRYYHTLSPANVPRIFTRETMQASKSAIKEDLFASVEVGDHPLLSGFEGADLPFTLGYVKTRAKPTSRVLLATQSGDPLLAVTRFGLGTTLAYTSDLTPRWGGQWLAWPSFGKFWAQAMRALVRRPDARSPRVRSRVARGTWRIDAWEHIQSEDDATPHHWRAQVTDDAGRSDKAQIRPVGVGHYRVVVPLKHSKHLTLRLHDPDRDRLTVVGHDRAYPPEYNLAASPDPALTRGAAGAFKPDAIRAEMGTKTTRRLVTPWLLLAAVVSFLGGLLLRRL